MQRLFVWFDIFLTVRYNDSRIRGKVGFCMKTFDGIRFAWTFRTYQQAVLDKASEHLRDGHIHIVAAPGSGKTILGLELVRRLSKPALILAPSVTIRRQWGERFAECFMPKGGREEDYVSEDLHTPQLLTCVTYQALHAAVQKTTLKAEDDAETAEAETAQDFTDFDILKKIRECGIGTICLDEAHHLRREWQKALEQFLGMLGKSVQVIALTATPPYDSTPAEWDNYIRVCGEVDEEIFVPQLVAQKTLCPHQDYLYFNMPTESESQALRMHRAHAQTAARTLVESGLLARAQAAVPDDAANKDPQGVKALSAAAGGKNVTMTDMQTALSFVLANRDAFPDEITEPIAKILSRNGVLEKGKACLLSTDKIDKMLLSSAGKIDSIRAIMASEATVLGEELRALILTDYIRKEMLPVVGSDETLTVMGAVPIFEAVRRTIGRNVPIALLAGTLVLLPNDVLDAAKSLAAEKGIVCTASALPNVPYSEVQFAGSNKNKVSVLTQLFQKGVLRVMIGTAALLGEGWDAPCINALILASYVGSFMLTNQMRGRAIRTDKQRPDKAANIWHLVTLDTTDEQGTGLGADFAVMQRRFDSFLAPAYDSPWIESGTDRLCLPSTTITETKMREVNAEMLTRSQDRTGMAALWDQALAGDTEPQVLDVCVVPNDAFSGTAARKRTLQAVLCAVIALALLVIPSVVTRILSVFALIPMLVFLFKRRSVAKPEAYFRTAGRTLLGVLRSGKLLHASENDVFSLSISERNSVYVAVKNASQHDKMLFSRAMGTLFSAIETPRYILLPSGDTTKAMAVPAVLDRRKEDAQRLSDAMKPILGKSECLYTRGQKEQCTVQRCRTDGVLNCRGCKARYKKIVVHK